MFKFRRFIDTVMNQILRRLVNKRVSRMVPLIAMGCLWTISVVSIYVVSRLRVHTDVFDSKPVSAIEDLIVRPNLYPDNVTVSDLHNFQFLINFHICDQLSIDVLTVVNTAVENREARTIIRETWGHPNISDVNTRLVFLLGKPDSAEEQDLVQEEALQYQDIIQGDFLDTYHNLTYKNLMGKFWVSSFCSSATFVLNADDDMFVDMYAMYTYLRPYVDDPVYLNSSFILGPILYNQRLQREPEGKHSVSYEDLAEEDVPGNIWPPFVAGPIYITNPGTQRRLYEAGNARQYVWVDDAFVTGILAKDLGIIHIDRSDLFGKLEYFDGDVLNRVLISKLVQSPHAFHRDYLSTVTYRQYELTYTLHKKAEWCFYNKCMNNLYMPEHNLSEADMISNKVVESRLLPPATDK